MEKRARVALCLSALISALSAGCGGDDGKKSDAAPQGAQVVGSGSNMRLAATKEEIVCNAAAKDFLFYVSTEKVFYVCDGAALTAIDLKGTQGPAGIDNHIVKTISCIGTISDTDSDPFWNGISLNWGASITKFGDVFATASVSGLGNFNVSNSNFYSASQNGALSGSVILSVDNFNFINISYDSALANIKAVMNSTNGHGDEFVNVNACTVLEYP